MSKIVKTKNELEAAIKGKAKKIVVVGDLAETLNTAMKVKTASKFALGLLAAGVATIPATGGLSMAALAPVAALTGIEVALIAAVVALGVGLVLLIAKDYKKVKFKAKKGDVEAELELERS